MGQSVNCALGGYDHRFDQGENTKKNLEHRTKNKNWQTDTSNFKSAIHDRFKNDPNNPIYLALLAEEERAKKARNFVRTVPKETFADNHYDPFYCRAYSRIY